MKKKLLLLPLILPFISGCSLSYTFNPRSPYPKAAEEESEGEEGGGEEEVEKLPMMVYFYLDYSHSEEGSEIYSMEWLMLTPLGECPSEAKITDSMRADDNYPHFIGYSEYSSCMDETLLWDFTTDYKQSNILKLYGVWVSQ